MGMKEAIEAQLFNNDIVKDSSWIQNSFLATNDEIDVSLSIKRFYTSADMKFTDSSLGGGFACNPMTQFTRYADIRRKGRRANILNDVSIYNTDYDLGQGDFYSDTFDEYQQLLFMEFGKYEFNSIFNFAANAVDQPTSVMANHLAGSKAYNIGKAAGFPVGLMLGKVAWAFLSLTSMTLTTAYGFVVGNQHASYYWFKPGMHVYWNIVNNLVTALAIEMGIVNGKLVPSEGEVIGAKLEVNKSEIKRFNDLFGNLMNEGGQIDVRAIVNRANRVVADQIKKSNKIQQKKTVSLKEWRKYLYGNVTIPKEQPIEEFINDVLGSGDVYDYDPKKSHKKPELPDELLKKARINPDGSVGDPEYKKAKATTETLAKYIESAMKGGARYAVFRVEYLGSQSVSFNNAYKDIPTMDALNSIGGAARNVEFMTAGGNIVGKTVSSAIMALKDFGEGMLSTLTFGVSNVLIGLLGGGYIEMSKMWDDSSMTVQEFQFKMQLTNPYNHPIANLQKKIIPMMMVLAGGVPLAIGKAAYTSPLLCNAYMRGMVDIAKGMITSITITTDTTTTSRDKLNRALGYEVSFTVTDFDNMISAPVSSMAFGTVVNNIDETSPMGRFMSRIVSRDIYTTKFTLRKAGLRLIKLKGDFNRATDPAFIGTLIGDTVRPLSGLFLDDENLITISHN